MPMLITNYESAGMCWRVLARAGKGQTCAEPDRFQNMSGSGKRKSAPDILGSPLSSHPAVTAKLYFQLALGVVKGENTVMDGSFEEPFVAL